MSLVIRRVGGLEDNGVTMSAEIAVIRRVGGLEGRSSSGRRGP